MHYSAQIHQFVSTYYITSVILYLIAHTIHGACMLPATSLCIMAGGFCFGTTAGSIYALMSGCIGGTAAYMIAQRISHTTVSEQHKQYVSYFHEAIGENKALVMIIIRLIPYIPFCAANIIGGLTLLPLRTFIWTLIVGITPSIWIYSSLGDELNMHQANTSPHATTIPLLTLIILSCAAWYGASWIQSRKKKHLTDTIRSQ